MDIVIDTSAVIAVLVGEPEKPDIVKLTKGHTLIGPGSIPWEVGNAFSAMFRQNRIPLRDALRGVETFRKIPLRLVEADFPTVLDISFKYKIYAYDSFFLDCAIRLKAPLLTLDARLLQIATKIGLRTLEV